MEAGINLLPQLTETEIKQGVYRRKINIAALATLGIVGLIIVGLIAYQIFLSLEAGNIQSRSDQATVTISKYQDVEVSNLALKQKLDKIEKILTTEVPNSTLVTQVGIAANTSSPIKITSLNSDSNGNIFVDGTAADSNNFNQWIDNLTSDASKEFFSKINLVTLNGSSDTGYKFSFSMSFLKKGVYSQ